MNKTPSAEQIAALQQYATKHGRTWKRELCLDWFHGRDSGLLRQIRNQFGPRWLETHGQRFVARIS